MKFTPNPISIVLKLIQNQNPRCNKVVYEFWEDWPMFSILMMMKYRWLDRSYVKKFLNFLRIGNVKALNSDD